ncbi:MAG: PAS domain-containing protein [Methylocystis sp.]|uniref:PAS domain-containing protein n=1 Tax=Methylocystis sp. TaxID=1911079 RepID=UPI0039276394
MTQFRPQSRLRLTTAREERARRNELALRLALRTVPMISFEWDVVRDIVRRFDPFDSDNSSSTGMFSRFAAVRDAVHPADRERFCADIEAALSGETERFETEIRVLSPNGIVSWFRELGIVERDQLGQPLRMIGVAHDITAQRDKHTPAARPPIIATSVEPLKALVIDKDRDAANMLALLLETVRIRVRFACSSADGVSALNEFRPQLVFVDISIPYVDAIEMIHRIRTSPGGNAVSLLALSRSRLETACPSGFDGLLTKPARFEALLDLLETLSPPRDGARLKGRV